MGADISDENFRAVCALFHEVSGIRLTQAKRALVHSRLHRLALEHGFDSLDLFVSKLVRGGMGRAVEVAVVDRLTTNETYFFREPQHFEHLRELAKAHRGPAPFCVWSAASSSGEEAYSAAMVLADVLGDADWRIYGTDLSTQVVAAARQGVYAMERSTKIADGYLRRYCLKGEAPYEGLMLIDRRLRQRVDFMGANLTEDLPARLPMFDVIFLRNVLIYFEPTLKTQIVTRVASRLRPNGVLYTGHAESLSGLDVPLRAVAPAIYTHA